MDKERVSCCSIAMHGKAPEHVFRVLSEAGYKKVDLLGRMPHFDLANADYLFGKFIRQIMQFKGIHAEARRP